MLKRQIISYSFIGVLNTLVHWGVFLIVFKLIEMQSISNVMAFICAVIFSFFMNARFTFKKKSTYKRMVWYMLLMGSLNFTIGYISDVISLPAFATLLISSILGPVLGFIFSKYLVFKG
ncbi:MAG: GtrA family protein [Pasteurellaceae bacterium]|nr:GtrA family protein [Pasteurellaceae bacterium]